MNVFEAIKSRRSIRNFLDTPVEEEKLLRVLEAGRLAPSAKNIQEWRFVIVKDNDLKVKLALAANQQHFIAKAGVIIVGCAVQTDYIMTCGQYAYPIDLAIAMDHMSLQAVEEGLGTCWIGAFNEEAVKKILQIPASIRVVELMPLGYPESIPSARARKKLEDIICFEKWHQFKS